MSRNPVLFRESGFFVIEVLVIYKYVCTYQHESAIRNTYTMKSYTPQAVAILIRGDKDVENKTLQKSVDAYVKKLSFF